MMRTLSRMLLTVGVAALMAAPLFAPGRPAGRGRGGFGGGNSLDRLLTNKGVQEELKLSEDDAKKAKDAADAVTKKHADDFKDLDRTKDEDRAKMREIGQAVSKEALQAVSEVLKPEQTKRL